MNNRTLIVKKGSDLHTAAVSAGAKDITWQRPTLVAAGLVMLLVAVTFIIMYVAARRRALDSQAEVRDFEKRLASGPTVGPEAMLTALLGTVNAGAARWIDAALPQPAPQAQPANVIVLPQATQPAQPTAGNP